MIQLEDKLYTSTEVADILGVSLRSVYRYLEENKIDAEVKTATGRHRFSKKNILDFLYPNGTEAKPREIDNSASSPAPQPKKQVEEKVSPKKEEVKPAVVAPVEEEAPSAQVEEAASEEEHIDWLAKFREAAKKYREEAESAAAATPAPTAAKQTPQSSTIDELAFVQNIATSAPEAEEVIEKPAAPVSKFHYYRSALGGLKDIAQNIDKGSRNSFLDYAFTLNAGLSLYKPIKPFSMLHSYVRSGDLSFFEKLLGLTPTDDTNAQLCLIVSDEAGIYKNKEELHGLFVVERARLYADIQKMGDSSLNAEAAGILK